jgi:hypothetical protein
LLKRSLLSSDHRNLARKTDYVYIYLSGLHKYEVRSAANKVVELTAIHKEMNMPKPISLCEKVVPNETKEVIMLHPECFD